MSSTEPEPASTPPWPGTAEAIFLGGCISVEEEKHPSYRLVWCEGTRAQRPWKVPLSLRRAEAWPSPALPTLARAGWSLAGKTACLGGCLQKRSRLHRIRQSLPCFSSTSLSPLICPPSFLTPSLIPSAPDLESLTSWNLACYHPGSPGKFWSKGVNQSPFCLLYSVKELSKEAESLRSQAQALTPPSTSAWCL